ncbi:MAG TPA: hypothetical protein VF025_07900 [Gaiellaceae bacterium]
MPDLGAAAERLASSTSRGGFLARVSRVLALAAGGSAVAALVKPGEADAYHFCGHIYTTDSCPHPTGLPRVDAQGFPLRARDGRPIDDLGRPIDANGSPVDDGGKPLLDPDGRPLPPAPRTRVCLDGVAAEFGMRTWIDGSWYRCCGGHVRKLIDCCSHNTRRINGDAALTGYCYAGRRVFCVMYYDTKIPC